jgi:ATP-binding protein involved in chromosome partitioning
MSYSESAALKALSEVRDPRTGKDIVATGMLGDLSFSDGTLRAILRVDPKMAEFYETVRKSAEDTLAGVSGVEKAVVILTAHQAAPKVSRTQSPPRKGNPHKVRRPEGYQGDGFVDTVIAISSAKGGVGKSTIAANLAVALAQSGKTVGLLDADVHGPSIPILFGVNDGRASTVEVKGRRLIDPITAHGVKLMSIGFLTEGDGPIVWRGPMVQGAISKMLWDVDWGNLDYLFIDMPPGTGDPQLGLAQDIKPKGAIIVSTPQDLALADARKGVQMFKKVDIPVMGLVENMSVFICPDCGSFHHIFGADGAKAEAGKMNVPFLGAAPLHLRIRESGDAGSPIAAQSGPEAEIFGQIAQAFEETLAG